MTKDDIVLNNWIKENIEFSKNYSFPYENWQLYYIFLNWCKVNKKDLDIESEDMFDALYKFQDVRVLHMGARRVIFGIRLKDEALRPSNAKEIVEAHKNGTVEIKETEIENYIRTKCSQNNVCEHPFIIESGIKAEALENLYIDNCNNLVIPMKTAEGKEVGVHLKSADGTPRFRKGSKLSGSFFWFKRRDKEKKVFYLYESFLTAAKQDDLTNVICVFSHLNYLNVAKVLLSKYPAYVIHLNPAEKNVEAVRKSISELNNDEMTKFSEMVKIHEDKFKNMECHTL